MNKYLNLTHQTDRPVDTISLHQMFTNQHTEIMGKWGLKIIYTRKLWSKEHSSRRYDVILSRIRIGHTKFTHSWRNESLTNLWTIYSDSTSQKLCTYRQCTNLSMPAFLTEGCTYIDRLLKNLKKQNKYLQQNITLFYCFHLLCIYFRFNVRSWKDFSTFTLFFCRSNE